MAYTLPELPYGFDDLEPHIDGRTMRIHHGKHHQGYTTKVNAALESHFKKVGATMAEEWKKKAGDRGASVLAAYN